MNVALVGYGTMGQIVHKNLDPNDKLVGIVSIGYLESLYDIKGLPHCNRLIHQQFSILIPFPFARKKSIYCFLSLPFFSFPFSVFLFLSFPVNL